MRKTKKMFHMWYFIWIPLYLNCHHQQDMNLCIADQKFRRNACAQRDGLLNLDGI